MCLKLTCISFQMQSTGDHEDPVYDTVEEMHISQPLASVENRPPKARRSVTQSFSMIYKIKLL